MGHEQTVAAQIARAAGERPEAIAIESADGRIAYGTLVRRAAATATRLRAAGAGAGTLVAIDLPRSIDRIVAMLGCWQAGVSYLPLDPAWPEARRTALVERAGCAAVIGPGGLALDDGEAEPEAPACAPDDLAYVIYTSGSTGEPKGVEVMHANLAALSAWHRDAFAVTGGTRASHVAGLGFDASVWETWPVLAAGGTLRLVDEATRLDPAALRDWLVAGRIDIAFAPTALAEPMVAMDWPADTALRTLLTGADRLTVRPRAGLPFALVNNYGPTECTVVATSGTIAPEGEGLPSIGRAIAGTQVHLLDGEIWIGGAQVARGYRGDPALTAERFVEVPRLGRLYRTGDRGARLPNGEIAFMGRVDAQVKVRGHRVEPAEVTAMLNRQPGVAASAVTVRDGQLVAYVVAGEGAAPSAIALRTALAEALPDYMVPARFALLTALPLTANGKLDAAALPDPAAHALPEAAPRRAAESPTERRLLAIVGDVIGRGDIGVEDDFFLLGGHSLLATQVVLRARDAFGIDLTLFHLFEGRSVARLAGTVEELVIERLASLSDEEVRQLAAG